jgi:hypothetical protein
MDANSQWPNKSPEPTAVGAVRSAVAGDSFWPGVAQLFSLGGSRIENFDVGEYLSILTFVNCLTKYEHEYYQIVSFIQLALGQRIFSQLKNRR